MFNSVILPVLIIFILLVLNGLFVAAEFAIVMASVPETQKYAKPKQKKWLEKITSIKNSVHQQDIYIATAQLGITLSSLGLGMYGEHVLAEAFLHVFEEVSFLHVLASHSIAGVLSLAVLTYFHVVIGEMIPKSLAIQHAAKTVLQIASVMFCFQYIMFPMVFLMNQTGNGLLRLLKLEGSDQPESLTTLDDFHYIIEESEHAGLLSEKTANLFQELLTFNDLKASDIMIPRVQVTGLSIDSSLDDIRELVANETHSRYPVYDDNLDEILGFIHVRDLLLLLTSPSSMNMLDLKNRPEIIRTLPFVPESTSLEKVLLILQKAQVQMAGVLDEYGGTAGILTLGDICAQVLDISAGSDLEQADIVRLDQDQFEVPGKILLSDLSEHLPADWEHPEVDTIGGLILFLLERPPEVQDHVIYGQFELSVTAIEGRGVKRCRITRVPIP